MSPETALVVVAQNFSTMPVYFNKAAALGDQPLERLKMVICADVCSVIYNKGFEKPLNPILGETFQARGQDGSKIYLEQISHHPPISYMLVEHENYTLNGSMEWVIRAGVQSAEVEYIGQRDITFKDGGCITLNQPKDKIYGLFMGTFGH